MKCIDINTIANVAIAFFALFAIFQTSIAILQTKRDSFTHLVLTMYTECRKIIDSAKVKDSPKNPTGLECFKITYEEVFRAELTKLSKKDTLMSPQKDVVPTINEVKNKFVEITNDKCPNIGTYLSSIVSILTMIDGNKTLGKKNKKRCASYIKSQTTKYEKIWLYYYHYLNKKETKLLDKYHIIDGICECDIFVIE